MAERAPEIEEQIPGQMGFDEQDQPPAYPTGPGISTETAGAEFVADFTPIKMPPYSLSLHLHNGQTVIATPAHDQEHFTLEEIQQRWINALRSAQDATFAIGDTIVDGHAIEAIEYHRNQGVN